MVFLILQSVSHIVTTHYKPNDFLTVSDDLFVDILDFYILDHALNLSDHCAIILSIRVSLSNNLNSTTCHKANHKNHGTNLRWDHANLYNYHDGTFIQLTPPIERIQCVYGDLIWVYCCIHHQYTPQCPVCVTGKASVIPTIEAWYNELVETLSSVAEASIPIVQVNALKFWWSQEASELKARAAISAHHSWINANKP